MRNTSVTNALRWMLAAWMLLATSVMSSVIHGRSGGYLSYQHDKSDCTPWCSSVTAAFHGDHEDDASRFAVDVHRHVPLALLGTTKCLPSSDHPTVPHDRSQCSWCAWVDAVSVAQVVRISSKELTIDQFWPGCLTSALIDGFGESKQYATLCSGIAPSFPLCDRARHERSGVQLA
jgi:uncharacterized protein YcbX